MLPFHHSTALPCKPFTLETYQRYVCDISAPTTPGTPKDTETPLTLRELKRQLQWLLDEEIETSLIVETGDSWFIGQSMRLPAGISQSNAPAKCPSQIFTAQSNAPVKSLTHSLWYVTGLTSSPHFPPGTKYHFQMQYGSIGWAIGATLGVALGCKVY